MIFSSRPNSTLDNHQTEHINYVFHRCAECCSPLSLRCAAFYDNQYKYLFESEGLPLYSLLGMLSVYFDSMSIDVNKESTTLSLTIYCNKGKSIPF